MPIYVVLVSFTEEGKRLASENPEQLTEITTILENSGAKILNKYGPMSRYDVVNVIEVVDREMIVKMEKALEIPAILQATRFIGPYPSTPHNERIDAQQIRSI